MSAVASRIGAAVILLAALDESDGTARQLERRAYWRHVLSSMQEEVNLIANGVLPLHYMLEPAGRKHA